MFFDRSSAGASLIDYLRSEREPLVLGIARGGVLVAAPVAKALAAPLDVLAIRKVGHPMQPELAIGAVSAAGDRVTTEYAADFSPAELDALFTLQTEKARALEQRLRGQRPQPSPQGGTVIIIDDGIATSATMVCAVAHARRSAARVVCAVPVAPHACLEPLKACADRIVVGLVSRDPQFAVGRYYARFGEVSDEAVGEALAAY
jgi:putative phosphoribosyl transferase